VKSQFIEMFTDTPKGKLSDIATITMGQSPDGKTYNTDGNGMPFYQGKTEFGTFIMAMLPHGLRLQVESPKLMMYLCESELRLEVQL
jgi:hypothetical protein